MSTAAVAAPADQCCALCKVAAGADGKLRTCGGCGIVKYCSAEHQKEDWKKHKGTCAQKVHHSWCSLYEDDTVFCDLKSVACIFLSQFFLCDYSTSKKKRRIHSKPIYEKVRDLRPSDI